MMYGKNKSAGATLGAAFLFLSFTAVPVSLRAVGLDIHFSPSINAVIDAWDEIAGAFQPGDQPVTTELLALNNQEGETPSDGQTGGSCQLASSSEDSHYEPSEAGIPDMMALPVERVEPPAPRARRAKPATRSLLGGRSLELASVRVEPLKELEFRPIEIAEELKSLVINREGLLKDFQKRTSQIRQAMRFAKSSAEVKVFLEKGKSSFVVRPAATQTWPCPPNHDIAPKLRRVRVAELAAPEGENSEI
ncbi:MAG TPA: hypothetical protein VFQ92_10580 [Blastocatellia bacterium]|nr:hypothetical protein [Blastocatellia bacterium]